MGGFLTFIPKILPTNHPLYLVSGTQWWFLPSPQTHLLEAVGILLQSREDPSELLACRCLGRASHGYLALWDFLKYVSINQYTDYGIKLRVSHDTGAIRASLVANCGAESSSNSASCVHHADQWSSTVIFD